MGCWAFFFFQAEDGIRDRNVTGVQTCALPISAMESFIAHQAFNEGDRFTIRRPPRDRQLQRRLIDRCGVALRAVDRVNLRSEERRVGKEWRCGWAPEQLKKKNSLIVQSTVVAL